MSNLHDTLIYDDPRYGDRYEIELDPILGTFTFATRFVDGIGRDPLYYDKLGDIPAYHRHEIEQKIGQRKH